MHDQVVFASRSLVANGSSQTWQIDRIGRTAARRSKKGAPAGAPSNLMRVFPNYGLGLRVSPFGSVSTCPPLTSVTKS